MPDLDYARFRNALHAACGQGPGCTCEDFTAPVTRAIEAWEAWEAAAPTPEPPPSGMTKAEREGLLWLLDNATAVGVDRWRQVIALAAAIRRESE